MSSRSSLDHFNLRESCSSYCSLESGKIYNVSHYAWGALTVSQIACLIIFALGAAHTFSFVGNMAAIASSGAVFLSLTSLYGIALDSCKRNKKNEPKAEIIVPFSNTPQKLPRDVWRLILTFVNFEDLKKVRESSKEFQEYANYSLEIKANSYGSQKPNYWEAGMYISVLFKQVNFYEKEQNEAIDPESFINSLKSANSEMIYKIYAKLESNAPLYDLLIKCILQFVGEGYIKKTSFIQNDQNKPLINQILRNNYEEVKLLLWLGANPNLPGENGSLPLYFAAQNGFDQIVSLLLNQGAVHSIEGRKGNALCFALGCGAIIKSENEILETVRILLDRGADPNLPSKDGLYPLHLAVQNGFYEIVAYLLSKGAKISQTGPNNDTILHYVFASVSIKKSESNVIRLIHLLIGKGANPNLQNGKGIYPIHLAAQMGSIKCLTLLIEKEAQINCRSSIGGSALYYAILGSTSSNEERTLQIVKMLLKQKAEPAPLGNNALPIHIAAERGFLRVLCELIQNGADVNSRTVNGDTPLHLAIFFHSEAQNAERTFQIAKMLLDQNAQINLLNNHRSSPLHIAAYVGLFNVIWLLINRGADVNGRALTGATPLCFLMDQTKFKKTEDQILKVVDILLTYDADPNLSGRDLPLHMAAEQGLSSVVSLLLRKGAKINSRGADDDTALCAALFQGKYKKTEDQILKVVDILLTYDADPNLSNDFHQLPLHLAAEQGLSRVVTSLLKKGANVNTRGKDGNIVLCAAMDQEEFEKTEDEMFNVISILVKKADLSLTNKDGYLPLHLAARNGFSKIVHLLIESGAYANAKEKNGQTALCAAMDREDCEENEDEILAVMRILLEKRANPHLPGLENDLPLQRAAQLGLNKVLKLLIDFGADVNLVDLNHQTPLGAALIQQEYGYTEDEIMKTILLLVLNGAKPNLQIITDAQKLGFNKIVKLLANFMVPSQL